MDDTVRIPVETRSIAARFLRPAGAGPYPGILLLMERPGVSAFTTRHANRPGADGIAGQAPYRAG